MSKELIDIGLSALERTDAAPIVGTFWAERWASRRQWRYARRLGPLLAAGGEAARRALAAYITALGEAHARLRLAACMWRHRATLRGHTLSWATVGYALTRLQRHHAAARWLADWHGRGDVRPWMLVNLVLALRALGRDAEAGRVSRHAVELPTDHCTPQHTLWLALDDLLEGRADKATVRLKGLDPAPFKATCRYVHGLTQILLDVEHADAASRRRAVFSARRKLLSLNRKSLIPSEDYAIVLRTFRRAVLRLAFLLGPWLGSILKLELWHRLPRRTLGR